MPRRLLLTTDVVGGVWDFVLALARELDDRSAAQVTILALGKPTPGQVDQAGAAGATLIVEPVKLEWMQDSEVDVRRTRDVIGRLARDLEPDVLHANQFAAACADVDIPIVPTLHSDVLGWRRWTRAAGATPPAWDAYTALAREALGRADRVIAVSAFLAADVRELYACEREIDVIHNGWPSDTQASLRGQRSRSTLTAGRIWDSAKNVALVAEAAQGWDPGPIYLAGQQANPDSGGRVDVPEPLQALGFLSRDELDVAMRMARVYVSAARYDPFGLLPLQAALNGSALVLSDIPSYRELWDGAATFFRSGDADDLRHKWSDVLEHPGVADELALRAQRHARERYSISRMTDAYADVYASLRAVAV
jgi:glycogen synthase